MVKIMSKYYYSRQWGERNMVGESHRQNTRILYGMLKAVDLLQIFTDLRYRPLDFDPPFFMIHIYLGNPYSFAQVFSLIVSISQR